MRVDVAGLYLKQRLAAGRLDRRRLLLLSGSAAVLAACGSGDDDKNTTGQATTSPAGQSGGQGTPRAGGSFTWSDRGDVPLDPTNNPTYRAQNLAGFTYARLLKFKTGPKPEVAFNYEIAPDLAASWELPSDGRQLTFKLRPDATFHNKPPVSGRPVRAEDVKLSLERFRSAPKNTNKNAFGSERSPLVESVATPDEHTVVMKLAKPYAPILNLFANPQYLWIMPKEVGAGFDPAKEQIGAGPWMLDQYQPDVSVTVKRNPTYFIKGRPYIESVTRAVIPEVAQAIAQFQAGRLDLLGVPAQNKAEVESSNPQAPVITYIPTTYTFIAPQLRGETPFKDVRVRRAISLAIDRAAWGELLYEGEGVEYLNAVPTSMGKWWLDPRGSDAGAGGQWFKPDRQAAREMLKAAGVEGMKLRYIFANNAYGEIFNQGAETTAGMLREAGFDVTTVTQDYLREYIDAKGTFFGGYEGVFYGLQTPFTDPHDYLFSMNHPASARNHIGLDDPRLTAMIDDEEKTLDEAERVKKVHDIQKYWMDQMYYIPVAVGFAYQFRQPWVKQFNYSATYGWAADSLIDAWLDRG